MAEVAADAAGYEVVEGEPPEVLSRNLSSGAHLLVGATVFFFLCFVFSYFYLRSLNNAGMWKPKGVDASVAWGTIVTACIVASAGLVRLGAADQRAGRRVQWRTKGGLALALGLLSLVLTIVEWTQTRFGPSDGGYASVFYGWTAFLFLFVLMTMYWLETVLAQAIRYRNRTNGVPAGEASGDAHREAHDIRDPLALIRPQLSALGFYWTFLAAIAVVAWIVLYLL